MLTKLLVTCLVIHVGIAKNNKDATKAELPQHSDNSTDIIAFSAELSQVIARVEGSPIEFDRELTNVGGLYFPNSGQFVCPDDSLYVFVWSLRKANVEEQPGMRCISKLRKGGGDVKFGPKTNYWSTSTSGAAEMVAVTQCSVPSAVTVVTLPWSETPGTPTFFYTTDTTFSGFKLQHDIAFTVELSNKQFLFDGSRIRFDTVISNFGGYYSAIDDCFRCPDDGVYVFSVSTHTDDPSTPWSVSRLMMDNDVILQGPITYRATESYDSGSASTTAVLQCKQGSTLYVEAQAAFDFPHNSYGAQLTSFSGYKLYDNDTAVAFSVVMANNKTLHNETVRFSFDAVITNIGKAFDVNQSQFICPDDDHYLFTWGSVTGTGVTDAWLCRDGIQLKRMYSTPQTTDDTSGTSGSSSMSAIYKCSTGSAYYIEGATTSVNEKVYLGGYTTFSGFKVPGE